ncbi:NUDIX hydrolase [Parafrankia colletiae]|uniref:NUDIX hydrolase n=1 Tax=Parafrankia colletiae TaxID=573497 RepID=A0A1S1QJK6_9ACTN|nr:NUDIX hydrolase [Parafrankia colletiae]MCK9900075.1 NUDIX hydrolase [Frankia sp. Cpl3]OHV33769.1 NUDIX hydrolase [Parafrankia colletiae]
MSAAVGDPAAARRGPSTAPVLYARVLLTIGDRIVVANHRGQPWFFLLGERVAAGEGVEQVLHRLLRRAAGFEVRSLDFVGGMERPGTDPGARPEIDLLFAGAVPRYAEFGSRLDDLDLVTLRTSDLGAVAFRPAGAGDMIRTWLADREPRWHTDRGSGHPTSVTSG